MAHLWGREWTKRDLLERVGDLSQIAGVESFTYNDGVRDGVRALRVRSGGGLDFTVLPSRGMDIGAASYGGVPFAWVSATGTAHPHMLRPEGAGWLRTFHGGLLTGCGLQNAGAVNVDGGEALGLHGYLSHSPAEEVGVETTWIKDEACFSVQGTIREAVVFGENLRLTRTITTWLGSSTVRFNDVVENVGFEPVPLMLLYHLNFGWPLISEDTEIMIDSTTPPVPRDSVAAEGEGRALRLEAPTPGYAEQCFFHDPVADNDGVATVRMVNRARRFEVVIRYDKEAFPFLTQWKMMGQGNYVCGIEPANCRVSGRAGERDAGRLQTILPGETRRFWAEITAREHA